jgi:predicted O-methyltransferase YrrM
MSQDLWAKVDHYITDLFIPSDSILEEALQASESAGLPSISVTPNQGKLLAILAQSIKSRSILEIGTLGGYSTIWLARALPPEGKLVTLEADPKHADVARMNIARASLEEIVEIRVGKALDTLPQLAQEGYGPFEFVFIDADKQNNADYFEWALRLTRPGSMIIVDNVVRNGEVIDADNTDVNIQGVRHFNTVLATESRVITTSIQTVGSKGYDGFAIALVVS